jgi:hypothetical protein
VPTPVPTSDFLQRWQHADRETSAFELLIYERALFAQLVRPLTSVGDSVDDCSDPLNSFSRNKNV